MAQKTATFSLHTLLVLLLILLGIGLRIGNPWELTFINDELSTWQKISFDSVEQVIQNIKVDDSHPVGMYVFLYYWTMLFGKAQWAIKLPFVLMSIASMGLVYQISKHWFNRSVALFVLAYFATLQFPIWWAAIARQYQSGLFCTLLMVYFWTQLLVRQQDKKGYWIGFILAGAAAMYNHYFSLIFAGIVGLVGFLWVTRQLFWRYILAGLSMVLLFLPHWAITQYQLTNADGHTWYQAPDSSFFAQHFSYIFHYEILCGGLILLITIGSLLYWNTAVLKSHWRQRLTALLFFWSPLLFGYFYSIYQAPILRESHLLFSFPYLLIFLLSFFPARLPNAVKLVLVSSIVVVNVYTLVLNRQHFQTMNSHPYYPFIANTQTFLAEHDTSQVTIVLGENPLYLDYYKHTLGATFEHIPSFRPAIEVATFRRLLEQSDKPYLIIGSLGDLITSMALDYYPYVIQYEQGINFEYYILSKKALAEASDINYSNQAAFDFDAPPSSTQWEWKKEQVQFDSTTNNAYYHIPKGEEWSFKYSYSLDSLLDKSYFLEMLLDIKTDSLAANGLLVMELVDAQGNSFAWFGESVVGQTIHSPQQWQTVYASMRLAYHVATPVLPQGSMVRVFYWNKNKQAVQLDNIQVQVRSGNKLLYKDTNPF